MGDHWNQVVGRSHRYPPVLEPDSVDDGDGAGAEGRDVLHHVDGAAARVPGDCHVGPLEPGDRMDRLRVQDSNLRSETSSKINLTTKQVSHYYTLSYILCFINVF